MHIADMRSALYELIQATAQQLTADAPTVIVSEVVPTSNTGPPSLLLADRSSHHLKNIEVLARDEVEAAGDERSLHEVTIPVISIVSAPHPSNDEIERVLVDDTAHKSDTQGTEINSVTPFSIEREAREIQAEEDIALPVSAQIPQDTVDENTGEPTTDTSSNPTSAPCEWCHGTDWREREDGLILCTCYFLVSDQLEQRNDAAKRAA